MLPTPTAGSVRLARAQPSHGCRDVSSCHFLPQYNSLYCVVATLTALPSEGMALSTRPAAALFYAGAGSVRAYCTLALLPQRRGLLAVGRWLSLRRVVLLPLLPVPLLLLQLHVVVCIRHRRLVLLQLLLLLLLRRRRRRAPPAVMAMMQMVTATASLRLAASATSAAVLPAA